MSVRPRAGRRSLPRPRCVVPAVLALLIVAAPARGDWDGLVRGHAGVLRSHDAVVWVETLRALGRHDHPAAVALVLEMHAAHRDHPGPWKRAEHRAAHGLLAPDPTAVYLEPLAGRRNVRSLRELVDGLDEKDEATRALCGRALATSPALHLVEDLLRERLTKRLQRRKPEVAAACLALLHGRLHVGDAAWAERLARDRRLDPTVRLDLVRACPDQALWRRLLVADGERALFEAGALETLVRTRLGTAEETASAALDAAAAEADRIAAALTTDTEVGEALAALDPPPAPAGLEALHQRRWRHLLATPALAGLADLHADFVTLTAARAARRDLALHAKKQRRRSDKRVDEERLLERAPTVDFAAPDVVGAGAVLAALAARLDATSLPGPRLVAPYHPELIALNRGARRTLHDVAFTPEERARHDLWQTVRAANAAATCATPAERAHVRIVNDYRADHALGPLRIDADLTTSARLHSEFQRAAGEIAHTFRTRREPHGQTPFQRMENAGYPKRYVGGENVLSGMLDPRRAFAYWRTSPGHRRNMLFPAWTEIGVGQSGAYWTQNFGREPYDEDHHAPR